MFCGIEHKNSGKTDGRTVNFLGDQILMGTYYHNMDVKGRMSFPNKLREIIGEKFYVTKGLDGCLFVYSPESWCELVRQLSAVPIGQGGKEMHRMFIAGASEVEADKQGRILITQALRDYAGLEKDVVVIGSLNRCEIWDKARWEKFNNELDSKALEEAIASFGFAF